MLKVRSKSSGGEDPFRRSAPRCLSSNSRPPHLRDNGSFNKEVVEQIPSVADSDTPQAFLAGIRVDVVESPLFFEKDIQFNSLKSKSPFYFVYNFV